jgi:hypothetical protein
LKGYRLREVEDDCPGNHRLDAVGRWFGYTRTQAPGLRRGDRRSRVTPVARVTLLSMQGGPGGGAPHLRHLGPTLERSMMDRVFLHAVGMQNRIFHLGRLGHGGQRLRRGSGGKVLPHLPPLLLLRKSLPLSWHLGLWKRGDSTHSQGESPIQSACLLGGGPLCSLAKPHDSVCRLRSRIKGGGS